MDNISKIFYKFFELPILFRILIFFIFWLLIIIALYFFIISPQLTLIESKKAELTRLKRQTLAIVKVKRKLKQFKQELKDLERNFKIALKKLPDSKEIPKLLVDITDNGKKYSLDFLLFKPGEIEKKEFFGVIPIEVKIAGAYHNIGQFLYDLANMTRIVKVPSFSLTPQLQDGILQMNGKIETYVFLKESLNAKNKKKKKK